jgi:hypothetical protein
MVIRLSLCLNVGGRIDEISSVELVDARMEAKVGLTSSFCLFYKQFKIQCTNSVTIVARASRKTELPDTLLLRFARWLMQ